MGEFDQDGVAGGVAVRVVDQLEPVEICEEQRGWLVAFQAAFDFPI